MFLSELFEGKLAKPNLFEGGNVFKNQYATQRINRDDVLPTVRWLERMVRIPLINNLLGSTGKKPTSGDIDIGIDERNVTKESFVSTLKSLAVQLGMDPNASVKKSGVSVHFAAPIGGTMGNGFVQVDFMFTGDMEWTRYMSSADGNSEYSGAHRAQLLSAIAKHHGLKITPKHGLVTRMGDQVITKDLDRIADMLLGAGSTAEDIRSVETMWDKLQHDPQAAQIVAPFNDILIDQGREPLG